MTLDQIQFWQMVATWLAVVAAVIAAFLAWRIGKKQNEINQRSLDIQNFVETFVMPQQVVVQDENGNKKISHWNLLIKNASSYPIYLKSFTLNGIRQAIGSSVIPNSGDNWYAIPISKTVQDSGILSLEVEFEDYLSNRYTSKQSGVFDGVGWQIRSEKRIPVISTST